MYLKTIFVVLALSWEFSVGEKCFICKQTIKSSDDAKKYACAAGWFEKENIPVKTLVELKLGEYETNGEVIIRDCGEKTLCMNKTEKTGGNITYIHDCAEANQTANKCEKPEEPCICSGDFCNRTEKPKDATEKTTSAAANLNGYQAILGTISSLIMIVVSK